MKRQMKESIQTRVDYIVTLSRSGSLIKALSKFRPNAKIIGVSNDPKLYTYFGAWYGVYMDKTNIESIKLFNDDNKIIEIAKKWGAFKGQEIIVCKNDDYRKIIIK